VTLEPDEWHNRSVKGLNPSAAGAELLRQINEERASALSRISRTLDTLITALDEARERIRNAPEQGREFELARWRDLHARAVKYRWYLEVQREALGMRDHRLLDEFYKIPSL